MPAERPDGQAARIAEFRALLARRAERDRRLALARGEEPPPSSWYESREGRERRFRELLERRAELDRRLAAERERREQGRRPSGGAPPE